MFNFLTQAFTSESASPASGTFARGIHPDAHKELAREQAIEVLPLPKKLRIPLTQHIGAPAAAAVEARTVLEAGDPIGTAASFVSANIHTPVAGKVAKFVNVTLANGRHVSAVPLTCGKEQPTESEIYDRLFAGEWPIMSYTDFTPDGIREKVLAAGIVGMGGAAFPTHVKLATNEKTPVDTILVNGCECEPYLTSDERVMREAPNALLAGALLTAHAVGAKDVIIATEVEKTQVISSLKAALAKITTTHIRIHIKPLASKYPMGGEKQTVRAALGRTIPNGGLPLNVGVVVINASTVTAIAQAVYRDLPLTHRVVTVTGSGISQPKNILAPIGASYQELIDFCGGINEDTTARIISGGPMMGFAIGDLETPVTKGTSGICVLTNNEVHREEETNCIRCGHCVDVCPLGLIPTKIALASRGLNWEMAERFYIQTCMECGCCAYECPASLPLVQMIRMGKANIAKNKAQNKGAGK